MFDVVLHAFVTMFIVIDPLGMLPVFLALTRGADRRHRRMMAVKGTAIGGCVLVAFALVGEPFLETLGIGMPAFRVAGGLMLLFIAFEMVFEKRSTRRSRSAQDVRQEREPDDISVFPLAIPLISGPGAVTSIMLLMGTHSGTIALQIAVLAVVGAVLAILLVLLFTAGAIERVAGPMVSNILSRLLGIVLAALAVQYVLDGVRTSWLTGG